jgi:adenylate cyclase
MSLNASFDAWSVPGLQRERRAVVIVDVVESVRLMKRDEAGFIERWRRFVAEVRTDLLPRYGGRLVKSLGDGLLIECRESRDAVNAALELHLLAARYSNAQGEDVFALRAGVHVDRLVIDELDVYGAGVNLAARIASLAAPGETLVSAETRDELVDGVDVSVVDLGECFLKHYEHSVRAYRVRRADAPDLQAQIAAGQIEDYRASIAVVPFRCVETSPGGKALGAALADDLIASLSRRPDLRVISRLSTQAFAGNGSADRMISESLGVAYVVCGSVHVQADQAFVSVELSESRTGSVLWADTGLIRIDDLFAAQDAFVPRTVSQIGQAVLRQELHRARKLPLSSLDRYTLYLGSIALLHRLARADFERARELLEHLCERESRSAAPHAMLAKWHMLHIVQGWSNDSRAEIAHVRDQVRRALDCDPQHAFARSLEAHATAHYDGDLDLAQRIAQCSVDADPQEPNAWLILSGIHSYLGLGKRAETFAIKARRLSPLDPTRFLQELFLSAAHLAAGRFSQAAQSAHESIRLNAMHPAAFRYLVIAETLAGRGEAARRAASRLLQLIPDFSVAEYVKSYPGRHLPHALTYRDALLDARLPA